MNGFTFLKVPGHRWGIVRPHKGIGWPKGGKKKQAHNGAGNSFQLESISEDLVSFKGTLKPDLLMKSSGTRVLPCLVLWQN